MTYNSIYGNALKVQTNNNIMNFPDFFFKLMINAKKSKEKEKLFKLNNSQYRI